MGKNVAVFVDVANIFYAAKAAGVDIDYVTLLKTASAGRDLVRAYAYTGLDPDNENQRNFHDFLRRHGYKVVSKDIRKYGDGKVKANLDIELVVDMMKTARNLDIAIVISGDGDFAPAIRAVQEMGVRVEVISFRGNTSSDLIEVADQFTEITQIARVEKGSSRSGRRVSDDDEDLSMTEVPDKQSEGSGTGRGRGRGRGRSRVAEVEPVAAAPRTRTSRSRVAASAAETVAAVTSDGTPLVVLPGEKLSRVAPLAPLLAALVDDDEDVDVDDALEGVEGAAEDGEAGSEQRRRRRRRGGRGRGRGRTSGLEEGAAPVDAVAAAGNDDEDEAADAEPAPAPAKRAGFAFGSVWDSQIGMPSGASSATARPSSPAPFVDDEDLDEPPIPEYLIAERRQRDAGRGQGGRGGGGNRAAYAAAMDRERYGGGRGAGVNRFAEPAPRGGRDDRSRGPRTDDRPPRGGDRPARNDRPFPRPAPRAGSGDEPWSEVPPEIEAMLRAQLGARGSAPARRREEVEAPAANAVEASDAGPSRPAPRRRTSRAPMSGEGDPFAALGAGTEAADGSDAPVTPAAETAEAAPPKRRTTRKPAAAKADAAPAEVAAEATTETAAPKRRTTRKSSTGATSASDGDATSGDAAEPAAEPAAPKKRVTRKKAVAPEA